MLRDLENERCEDNYFENFNECFNIRMANSQALNDRWFYLTVDAGGLGHDWDNNSEVMNLLNTDVALENRFRELLLVLDAYVNAQQPRGPTLLEGLVSQMKVRAAEQAFQDEQKVWRIIAEACPSAAKRAGGHESAGATATDPAKVQATTMTSGLGTASRETGGAKVLPAAQPAAFAVATTTTAEAVQRLEARAAELASKAAATATGGLGTAGRETGGAEISPSPQPATVAVVATATAVCVQQPLSEELYDAVYDLGRGTPALARMIVNEMLEDSAGVE